MSRTVKFAVSGLTILGLIIGSVAPSEAAGWGRSRPVQDSGVQYAPPSSYPQYTYASQYQYAGDYGYPVQPVGQDDHPILKKVLVGGALLGIGFLAGRLTAPKPQYNYYPPVPQYQPQFNPTYGPRPGHGHHRF